MNWEIRFLVADNKRTLSSKYRVFVVHHDLLSTIYQIYNTHFILEDDECTVISMKYLHGNKKTLLAMLVIVRRDYSSSLDTEGGHTFPL